MKRRNFKDSEFYCISNPLPQNEDTGMFCVNWKFIEKYDKDFLFEWVNPVTRMHESKVLSKEYVKNHLKYMPKWKEEEFLKTKFKRINGYFFMISYSDIIKY